MRKQNSKRFSTLSTEELKKMNSHKFLHITAHGRKRIMERFNCKPNKYMKILCKAWKSKNKMSTDLINRLENGPSYQIGDTHKYFMGYVFVFRLKKRKGLEKHSLITLFDPKKIS